MKANKMPERIYIFDYNDAMLTPLEGDTTYVREDAFIEKATQFLKDKGSAYITIIDGQLILRKGVVKDFRKYMKGE